MTRKLLSLLSVFLLTSIAVSTQAQTFTKEQEAQIKTLVKETLVSEPEILQQASIALENKLAEQQQKETQQAIKKNHDLLYNDPNSPYLGPKDAKITLVYFSDYNCTFCKRYESVIQQLRKEYPDVAIIFKPLAFLGEGSKAAAEYSLTSWGKNPTNFETMHNSLMASKERLDEKKVVEFFKKENLTVTDTAKNTLAQNMQLARSLGIQGTPTTIINDTFIPGAVDYQSIESIIKQSLKDAKK